jgi:hypothetical protein
MTRCGASWAARCWLILAALQLLLRPSTAALVVVEGPREFVGFSLASPPFKFTPETFRVRAPLALVDADDFDYRHGRIGAYRGNQSLEGKIVVHVNVAWESVSMEQHARKLGALGAVGWAMANVDILFLHPVQCYACRGWSVGDTRSLASPVAVDITSPEMLPLLDALRAGLELVAELSPSPFPGRAAYGSWWYWLLSAACTLQICHVFELAIAKLHALVRVDGGLRASVPQLLLAVELCICLLRFVICSVDPFIVMRLVPFRVTSSVLTLSITLSTVASSLFLVFFAEAAASSGMASMRIAPRYRRGLLVFSVVALAMDICINYLSFAVKLRGAPSSFWVMIKTINNGVIFPVTITVMAYVTALPNCALNAPSDCAL